MTLPFPEPPFDEERLNSEPVHHRGFGLAEGLSHVAHTMATRSPVDLEGSAAEMTGRSFRKP